LIPWFGISKETPRRWLGLGHASGDTSASESTRCTKS
jgi:hypothetical protein